jgi:hypothetical protein
VNGNVNLGAFTLTVAAARNITINGAIRDGAGTPGLLEGRISHPGSGFDETTPNPATLVQLGVRMGQTNAKPPWGDYETWVYTGQFYDADGIFSFAENIDDNVSVKIDGVLRLRNELNSSGGSSWYTPTTTGSTTGGNGRADANTMAPPPTSVWDHKATAGTTLKSAWLMAAAAPDPIQVTAGILTLVLA